MSEVVLAALRWEVIDEFPTYEVCEDGLIRNARTGRILRPSINQNGVLKINLMKEGNPRPFTRSVASIVCVTFHGDRPPGAVVGYINRHLDDVSKDNLEWIPKWFVQERAAQERRDWPLREGKILMESTGIIYDDSLECARAIDGIEKYIVLCASSVRRQSYKGSYFRWWHD